jgi:hypothetical protein
VGTADYIVDFKKQWSVSFSEFDLKFGDFRAKFLVESSLFEDVVIESNGLYFFLKGWELFDFLLNFFLDGKLNIKKGTSSSSDSISSGWL